MAGDLAEKADDPILHAATTDADPVVHLREAKAIDEVLKAETKMARVGQKVRRKHVENQTDVVVRKAALAMARVGQKVHRREVMTIVEARRANVMLVVTADQAGLRTWITVVGQRVDHRRVATLIVDRAVVMTKAVRRKTVTNLAVPKRVATAVVVQRKIEDHRLVDTKAASSLGLRCEVDDHRSLIADLGRADLRGCRGVSHRVADLHSKTVGRVALRWGHRG